MTISSAYTNWSETYDTDRNHTRDLDQAVTAELFTGKHYRTILELGSGTGKNTALFTTIADRVLGLDFSEGMLRQARTKVGSANIGFAIADFMQPLPCAAKTFDLVVTNLVLEHIADLTPVFTEAYRVLANGGQFFISELHPVKQYLGGKATFYRDQQPTEITAFIHHISDFVTAGLTAGFTLIALREHWHDSDPITSPRLVSFLFQK